MGNQPVTTQMLLRGALVADAIAATTRRADVLLDGPVIAALGPRIRAPDGSAVIDLPAASVICPGFIDAHVHAEGPLLARGRIDGALAQGVTTLVTGQDGQSFVGATAATARYLSDYFTPVNGALEPARDLSIASFSRELAGKLSQNVAVLASQGTIRHNIAGLAARPLEPAERAAARRQLEQALADGAVGLSSGLHYLPSRYATAAEIADIARPLAAAGRPYVSHLRGYGPGVQAGLDELITVGRAAGIRVHASHLWGAPADIGAAFTTADSRGVALTYDMYPYRRSSTILATMLLPPGLQANGPAATIAALTDPRQRTALLGSEQFTDDNLREVYLGCLPPSFAGLAGLSITEAAAHSSQPAGEWALNLLARTRLNAGAHLDRPSLTDDHLAWLASHPRHCGGSDGIYQGQHPHPRGHAAFARLAAHYLKAAGPGRGHQDLSRHLAANPADAYGLANRGRIAPGMAADLCVIGPAGITAHATYDTPQAIATGVDIVVVNGIIIWQDSQPVTARHPGELLT